MKKTVTSVLITGSSILLVAIIGCGGTTRLYEGPRLPPNEIAIICVPEYVFYADEVLGTAARTFETTPGGHILSYDPYGYDDFPEPRVRNGALVKEINEKKHVLSLIAGRPRMYSPVPKAEVLPGFQTLSVGFNGSTLNSVNDVKLTFEAKAGHRYEVFAVIIWFETPDSSRFLQYDPFFGSYPGGLKEGLVVSDWKTWVLDATDDVVVAQSK